MLLCANWTKCGTTFPRACTPFCRACDSPVIAVLLISVNIIIKCQGREIMATRLRQKRSVSYREAMEFRMSRPLKQRRHSERKPPGILTLTWSSVAELPCNQHPKVPVTHERPVACLFGLSKYSTTSSIARSNIYRIDFTSIALDTLKKTLHVARQYFIYLCFAAAIWYKMWTFPIVMCGEIPYQKLL